MTTTAAATQQQKKPTKSYYQFADFIRDKATIVSATHAKHFHFGIYSKEEITKMSVVTIEKPVGFDSLNQPVRGGCYDRRMGPFSIQEASKYVVMISRNFAIYLIKKQNFESD
jgi:hypothetical protein